jgi:thioredoxin 1
LAADTWAVCLCADWCGTCRDWRAVVDQAAQSHPGVRWRWLDIEDEADLMGDMDIETLPCLLLARGDAVLFFGPVTPQPEVLSRLVQTLSTPDTRAAAVDGAVNALWHRIAASLR